MVSISTAPRGGKAQGTLVVLAVVAWLAVTAPAVSGQGTGQGMGEELVLRGRVISVKDMTPAADYVMLEQVAEVVVTGGEYRGEVFTIENILLDHPYYDIYLTEGQEILLLAGREGGEVTQVYLKEVMRDRYLYYLGGLFVLMLLLIGGVKGVKTVLALGFTILVIIKILLPLVLQGYDPVLVAGFFASVAAIFTLVLVGGWEKKTLAAVVGTVSGVLVAGFLALWVGNLAHLTGFSSEEAQMLMFMDSVDIDVRGLLFAGIIIGSLGAVTDVGISIASAVSELKKNDRRADFLTLVSAGINIGRDIMGTMANTLILAYVGSATPLLLVLLGYEMTWVKTINLDMIATEVVRSLAGSIGLVVTVPVTALASAWLMKGD